MLLVRRDGSNPEMVAAQAHDAVALTLAKAGAVPAWIHVEVVAGLPRQPGHASKFKLVESRVGAALAGDAAQG